MSEPVSYYVINLDRSPDRLAGITENLDNLGLSFERIKAVDSRTFPDADISKYYDGKYSVDGGCYLRKAWVCITLSHVAALQEFLTTGNRFCVVLEDDANLLKEAPMIVDHLANQHLRRTIDFDIVELMGPNDSGRKDLLKPITEIGPFVIGKPYKTTPVAAAMLYSRTGAEKFVRNAFPIRTHWDNYVSLAWIHGAKTLTVRPYPVAECKDNMSTYAATGPSAPHSDKAEKIAHPTHVDKLRRLAYRLYQGPRRWLHNMIWMGPAACLKIPGAYVRADRRWHKSD